MSVYLLWTLPLLFPVSRVTLGFCAISGLRGKGDKNCAVLQLKQAMGGKCFRSDEEVQQAVHEWLHCQPKEFFARGNSCTSEALEHLYGTQWRLHRKMKSLCTFCVQ